MITNLFYFALSSQLEKRVLRKNAERIGEFEVCERVANVSWRETHRSSRGTKCLDEVSGSIFMYA